MKIAHHLSQAIDFIHDLINGVLALLLSGNFGLYAQFPNCVIKLRFLGLYLRIHGFVKSVQSVWELLPSTFVITYNLLKIIKVLGT